VFGFEFPHSLRVFEPLAQCVDKDRIKAVNAGAVVVQDLGGLCDWIAHAASFGWR
jgi:hypothetical protein